MLFNGFQKFGIGFLKILLITSIVRTQSIEIPDTARDRFWSEWVKLYNFQGCIEDLPPPMLFAEPRYTQGTSNIVYFKLPPFESISLPADSIKNPFVMTLVYDESGSPLRYPLPVDLTNDSPQSEIIDSLTTGVNYRYTSALFIPVCKIDCGAVEDSTQLDLHCSAYRDTVVSIQDASPPFVQNVRIPEVDGSPVSGWWNQSTFRVQAELSDAAGVWQGFLYRRECGASNWDIAVADTTFEGELTPRGYLFAEQLNVSFSQNLADGCYEFHITGKDAAHTPESSFPNFELAGNGGEPAANAPAQVSIKLDMTPPESVTLACEQILNTVRLTWSRSEDVNPGIGLAGYRIFRDGQQIETVALPDTTFIDNIGPGSPDREFSYQIQPFDSLGNVQTAGGSAFCFFSSFPQIAMAPEPEFTSGTSNQVCWTGSPKIDSYRISRAEECDYQNAVSVEVPDTCFTFLNLENGKSYCYWVTAIDEQQRLVVSDTVHSIQDASAPKINQFEVSEVEILNDLNWLDAREIEIQLDASDATPGKIVQIQIFENGNSQTFVNLDNTDNQVDTTFVYLVKSEACSPFELSVQVSDAAANQAVSNTIPLQWDETPPEPVAALNCTQLAGRNGMRLNWNAVRDPGNCSGLAGYRIFRDGALVTEVTAPVLTYEDIFPEQTPTNQFTYQIQPFDSLGNVQTAGTTALCDYIGAAQIAVNPMPEFTPGLSNDVCWEVSGTLASLALFLDRNGDLAPDDSVIIANPSPVQTCHSFENLQDGVEYHYWLRGIDSQERLVKSDTVMSTQDNTSPVIDDFAFPEGDVVNDQVWAYSREIDLRLAAHDASPGEIWNYRITENGQPAAMVSFKDSSNRVNQIVPYVIQTNENQAGKIDLSIRVFDGAGNESDVITLVIFLQEKIPDMFAFPNPFNPMQENSTIRLNDVDETEVRIYDFFGNLVRVLAAKTNSRDFVWDGRNGDGNHVANGGFICVGSKTGARFKIGVAKR